MPRGDHSKATPTCIGARHYCHGRIDGGVRREGDEPPYLRSRRI
jgi:hypothetical protein